MPQRDDFTEQTKRIVAQRAAYRCSKPDCRIDTIGPHTDSTKSLSNGIAAHICAAASGGPRYDSNQTQEERKDIDNAIWLCHNCSDIVDKDEEKYPPSILREWKSSHEQFISDGGGLPNLPEITIQTLDGLTLPTSGTAKITGDDITTYRKHVLEISNRNNQIMPYFKCRIQFPEPIIRYGIDNPPAGSIINCTPDNGGFIVNASGFGSVTMNRGATRVLDLNLDINEIPPQGTIKVHFISIASDDPDYHFQSALSDSLMNYILGEFQYKLHDEYLSRRFLVRMVFESSTRKITSSPCEDYDKTQKLVHRWSLL